MLFQDLRDASLGARKANDVVAKTIYGVLLGEIGRLGDPSQEVTDEMVSKAAEKTIAGIVTSLEKGGPNETLSREKDLLSEFVITKASAEEVTAFVAQFVAENPGLTMRDMGKVMGATKVHFDGKLDGGSTSQIIKAALA
ncbi:Yqey-like protein [compost metagenome]